MASGQVRADRRLLIDERGGVAGHVRSGTGGERADRRRPRAGRWRRPSRRRRRRRAARWSVPAAAAGATPVTPGIRATPPGVGARRRRRRSAGARDRHGHRRAPGAGEVARHQVGHRAGALALGDHGAVDRRPHGAERRERGRQHQQRGEHRHRPGRRMTACGEAVPAAARRAARLAARASFDAPQRRAAPARSPARPAAATSATVAPAMPIDFRKPGGNRVSVTSAPATVPAENRTVRPARDIVTAIASRVSRPGGQLLAEAGDQEQRVVDRQARARGRSRG